MTKPMRWHKLNGEAISEPLQTAVENAIWRETEAGNKLKVCIGTDSQVYGDYIDFATVVVFIREKKGGFMFISDLRHHGKMTIKERMLNEVSRSIAVAYELCDLLDMCDVDLEVHADINTNPQFKSNPALSEAMGYIMSMGFVFKAKPDSFASSSCANKVV